MKPAISIVVPVIDQADLTIRCFNSIRMNTTLPYEIIWVDNHSQKENFKLIKRQVAQPGVQCRVILNPENMGFIKATNQGIDESRGEYIVLLNNDTLVYPGWDVALIKPLMHDAKVGAVGPHTHSRIAWQTAAYINAAWNTRLPPYVPQDGAQYYKLLKGFQDHYLDVTKRSLAFFCAAFRKKTFDKLGTLCEELSIGLGDDDEYCMRLRAHGYKLLLSLGTFVTHVHRATFNTLKLGEESLRNHNLKIIKKKMKEYQKVMRSTYP